MQLRGESRRLQRDVRRSIDEVLHTVIRTELSSWRSQRAARGDSHMPNERNNPEEGNRNRQLGDEARRHQQQQNSPGNRQQGQNPSRQPQQGGGQSSGQQRQEGGQRNPPGQSGQMRSPQQGGGGRTEQRGNRQPGHQDRDR